MPAKTDSSERVAVLLDSNTLANLSLYFEACASAHKKIGSRDEDMVPGLTTDERTRNCLHSGYKGYQTLHGHGLGLTDIYVSRVSSLEVMNLYMERAFDEQLSHCNIPFRIRPRRPFRCQVTFDYGEKVENPWQSFLQTMEDTGLPIKYAEEFMGEDSQSEGFRLILEVTKAIAHLVALEDVDLYLCAAAFAIPVNRFYSCDHEVRQVMNAMRTNKDWRNVADRVIDAVCATSQTYRELVNLIQENSRSKYETIPRVTRMS